MSRLNVAQRQFVVLALLTNHRGRRFTYAEVREESRVYDYARLGTEDVSDDLKALRRLGLVATARSRASVDDGREGTAWAREGVTKAANLHLTWAEHRVLNALRVKFPPAPSPSPAPVDAPGKLVDLLKVLREAEESTRTVSVADLVQRTGLSRHVVRARLRDMQDLADRGDHLPFRVSDFLRINETVDWSQPLVDEEPADDEVASQTGEVSTVVIERPAYWLGDSTERSTLVNVGLDRLGLFPYSVDETLDRLGTLIRHAHTVTSDDERYHLEEARWKLMEWLAIIAPTKARQFTPQP